MTVTTYTRDGVGDVKQLIKFLVEDLTGQGDPIEGTAAQHMRLVYPTDLSILDDAAQSNVMVILEATTNIDPFGRDDDTNDPTKDPWRICFHTARWTGRSIIEMAAPPQSGTRAWEPPIKDPIEVNSLAIYVGTPSTISYNAIDDKVTLGWKTTPPGQRNKTPIYYKTGGPILDAAGNPLANGKASYQSYGWSSSVGGDNSWRDWLFKETYNQKDLIEPVGNTGAEWTNTFDPTDGNVKFQNRPTITSGQSNYPTAYKSPAAWDGPDVENPDQLFINKYVTAGLKSTFYGFDGDSSYADPISYRIVLTDHGLFLGCWGPDPEESGRSFSWLLCQRPVDKNTGIVRDTPADPSNPGNRPLFCVNSVNGKFYKFVVREHDSPVPSSRKDAAKNTPDSGAVINPYQQQSLTENGEYVITFLNNLNSSRFKYADELDMVGTVSSDVVGGGSQIQVNVYGEKDNLDNLSPRTYHALWSSGSYGTKMRIMVVKDIPNPNTPE